MASVTPGSPSVTPGSVSVSPGSPSGSETLQIGELVKAKAKELFDVCDRESKGYLSKADLQGLHGELELDDEQLCQVFEKLDRDQSGFLSFEEFCLGFGGFLGLPWSLEHDENNPELIPETLHIGDEDTSHDVASTSLWSTQSGEFPNPADDYFQNILEELNATRKEKAAMERTLKERSESYEKRIHQLSEEMEEQIRQDQMKIFELEVIRGRNVSMELKNELKKKDEHLDEVMMQQRKLEEKVTKLRFGKSRFVNENNKLMQLNEDLAKELQETRRRLDENQLRTEYLKQRRSEEENARLADEEARRLDQEKKSLLNQLKVLREHNRKLRDDRDEFLLRQQETQLRPTGLKTSTPARKYPLLTQGSNLGKYFPQNQSEVREQLYDEPVAAMDKSRDFITELDESRDSAETGSGECIVEVRQRVGSDAEEDQIAATDSFRQVVATQQSRSSANQRFYRKLSQVPDGCSSSDDEHCMDGTDIRRISVSSDNLPLAPDRVTLPPPPDRVYKVVVVGNSGVGKTSFIQRFVSKSFKNSISATIGIDYQVKTISLGEHHVALQIWDTAGQERYRSITRQYFRKADGIIVIYDVTNEKSYLSVRNWMQNIEEGTDLPIVVMLLGNKCDVASKESRQVMPEAATKLADEFNANFFETSAKSGRNVTASMRSLSSRLADLEDRQRENAVIIATDIGKRSPSSCCVGNKAV